MKRIILILGLAMLIPTCATKAQVAARTMPASPWGTCIFGAGRGCLREVLDCDGWRSRQAGDERHV